MEAIRLRTEYMKDPIGIDVKTPRFSWNVTGGIRQNAYQIIAKEMDRNLILWDSGKVYSSSTTGISWAGSNLQSRQQVEWSVTVWDEKDEKGIPASATFEMGFLNHEDWKADWISGDYQPSKKRRHPADYFSKSFEVSGTVRYARLYASARGIYQVNLDGVRRTDFLFAPGITDYRKRLQVQVWDLTEALSAGEHRLDLILGDGWYRGSLAAYGVERVYGDQTSVIAQLEITFEDGRMQTIATGGDWNWCNDGQIRENDLKDGETFDARMLPSFAERAKVLTSPKDLDAKKLLCASNNVPVREHEQFTPVLLKTKTGGTVLDFGQNIAGILAFHLQGRDGEIIDLTCGEILDENGNVSLENIQEVRPQKGWTQVSMLLNLMGKKPKKNIQNTPLQHIRYICKAGDNDYKTSFAIFGFRYVQVTTSLKINPEDFTAIAVYSDLEQTGSFTCSNEQINRLVENTRWSMKGNFLDIPTDCPTRERLGWTGDAQVFFNTGAYLMDTAPFFEKFLRDIADNQYPNGLISAVIPYEGAEMMYKAAGTSVGWADAIYLLPYRFWKRYGDREVLERSWPMMERYADYLLSHLGQKKKKEAKANPYNQYTYEKGVHLGEWLEPEEFRDQKYGASQTHPEECTAYLYLTMKVMAEIAEELGKKEAASKYQKTAEGAKLAYQYLFGKSDALSSMRQAKLVRPLAFGLLDQKTEEKAEKQLLKAVKAYGCRVGTGVLSTPFLLKVLSDAGYTEEAWEILENTKSPGWLYEILQGSTTIWEDWEGKLSRNHYSPGAVCEWLFDTAAGIRVSAENVFEIIPNPGGTLEWAECSYSSIYGTVVSRWEKFRDGYRYQITVPSNTSAHILLPDGRKEEAGPGTFYY